MTLSEALMRQARDCQAMTSKPTPTAAPTAPVAGEPVPRTTQLPLGGAATTLTREQMTILYHCSHGELGRLLVRRMAPLPIRVDSQILWFVDEAHNARAQVQRTLERWRHR